MTRLAPAWWECIILALFALGALLIAGMHLGDERTLERPLLERMPSRVEVRFDDTHYRLILDTSQPLVADAEGRPVGRLRRPDAAALQRRLGECRILRRLPPDAGRRLVEFGLERPVLLRCDTASEELRLGSVGGDRGFALADDGAVLVLDLDPAGILRRTPAALREGDLGLPQAERITHDSGWALDRRNGRWWLQQSDTQQPIWTSETVVEGWIESMHQAPVIGYGNAPTQAVERASLIWEGADGSVRLVDLGPGSGGRLLQRRQTIDDVELLEYLLVDIDPALLAVGGRGFRSRHMIPLDPREADLVRIGAVTLQRDDAGDWVVGDHGDGDQVRIHRLLKQLAALPATRAPVLAEADGDALLDVRSGELRFTLDGSVAGLAQLAERLKPLHLRDHRLLPGLDPEQVSFVIITPVDGIPQQHEQGPDGWSDAVGDFLHALAEARVEQWTSAIAADQARASDYQSSITLATPQGPLTVRLRSDGSVAVPQRGLRGVLDTSSKRRVLEQ